MLHSLHVRDLALIGTAELRFDRGLNVLSGATGGGKSLVVTAMKLLRGEKASAELVRHGAAELRIDAEFHLGEGPRWEPVLARVREVCGGLPQDAPLVVTRIVDARGRSSVRIDGRPATLRDLRELGEHLIEIHGQGDSRALMRPETQAEALDAFGGTVALRLAFGAALARARAARQRLDDAAGNARERLARAEFLRFQLAEMEDIGLEAGELEACEAEHQVLAHLDRMRELLTTTLDAIGDAEPSASELVARAERALVEASAIDRRLTEAAEQLAEARVQLDEAARTVQSRLADLDLDPARLGALEDRLATLRRALARFGPTEAEFLARRQAVVAELATHDAESSSPEALEAELRGALDELAGAARKLLRARRKAAPAFVANIERELADLGMADTKVEVRFDDELPPPAVLLERASPFGPSPLDLAVRVNPGEPFTSMRDTASGGETARIVLAIKKCLADQDRVPFVVFDEIDAEIGGRLGLQVGRKLRDVARDHQVLIVTHLPQVAAFADAHWKVDKLVKDGRTYTTVARLDAPAVERELAAMSVGEGADPSAVAEARRLVARARGGEAKTAQGE
ncbi:MAG: DNA repair protein RecN [Planctomycetes bacterium]|nr:DNA repair protein RecN [Planctomycetota bacterium]